MKPFLIKENIRQPLQAELQALLIIVLEIQLV